MVKASGLRWISLMWLGHVPWAGRHWAPPVLTVLAPSARYYQQRGRRHKKLTDWARQMVMQLRRWLPQRPLALVGDNGYAVLDLLHCCQSLAQPVTLIARLRRDAALYAPAPPRQPGQQGRPPLKGARRPAVEGPPRPAPGNLGQRRGSLVRRNHPHGGTHVANGGVVPLGQASRPHPLGADPRPPGMPSPPRPCCAPTRRRRPRPMVLEWFVLRWQLEVTFQEVRTHLGVETQRQWSDLAIARTTPVLLGIFSWTALAAHGLKNSTP